MQNYDDDGNALNGGCPQSSTCAFVHPTHPRWGEARKSNRGSARGRGSRGRGRDFPHPIPKPPSPTWDPSSWGSSGSAVASSSSSWKHAPAWGGVGDTDATVGSSTPPASSSKPITDTGSWSWGSTSIETESSKKNAGGGTNNVWEESETNGWGETRTNGWGETGANGWGNGGRSRSDRGTGWTADSNLPIGHSRDARRDSQSSASVSQTDRRKPSRSTDDGWAMDTDQSTSNVDMRYNEDSTAPPPNIGPKIPIAEFPPVNPPLSVDPSLPPLPADLHLPGNPSLTAHPPLSVPPPLPAPPSPTAERSWGGKTTGRAGSSTTVGTSSSDTSRPRERLTRKEIYTNTIRYMYHAVRIQLDLQDTQADADRWKRTQSSPLYAHATPGARRKIDEVREAMGDKISGLTKDFKSSVKLLVDLPHLSTSPHPVPADIDEHELIEYTAELGKWMKQLNTFHHVKPQSRPREPLAPPQDFPNDTLSPWEKLQADVAALDHRSDLISEDIYIKKYITLDGGTPTRRIEEFQKTQTNRTNKSAERIMALLDRANRLDEQLGAEAERAVVLLREVHQNEKELQRLRAEKEEYDKIKPQVEAYLRQFDVWRQEDEKRIQELTEKMKNLHAHNRQSHSHLKVEDLLPSIGEMVTKNIREEIVPVLEHFRAVCAQNNNSLVKEVYKKLQPTLDLTEDLCRRAQEEMRAQVTLIS